MMFGFTITSPREYLSYSWITFPWKTKKKLDYNINIQECCYSCHALSYIQYINQHMYSVKYNTYWLMS